MTETVNTADAANAAPAAKIGPLDVNQIQAILRHRYPFLLVDRVLELERRKKIVALKNVTINEPFFAVHFPGAPIIPGVLFMEAMARAGAWLLRSVREVRCDKLVVQSLCIRYCYRSSSV